MKDWQGHLQYSWWKYLLVILLPILLWCSVFDVLAKPKENERLHILFVGNDLDAVSLQQTLEEAIPTLTDQKIKEVKVVTELAAGEIYGQKMTTYSYEFDLIIVSQSFMRDNTGQFFRRLPMDGLPGYETVAFFGVVPCNFPLHSPSFFLAAVSAALFRLFLKYRV